MNTTALAVRELTPNVIDMAMKLAPTFKDSRLFGVATEAQAAAICLKGYELGLSLTASFELIHVIDSKPGISPRGALALILNSPLLENLEIKDETDDKGLAYACTVTMKRKNGFGYTARFTMDDAKRAGLVKAGSGWEKYPANMLRHRAIGFAADMVFPDVIGGLKRADELGADIDPAGNVVDATWTPVSSGPVVVDPNSTAGAAAMNTPAAKTGPTLQDLVNQFGPEAVMAANGGKIPATDDEVAAVAAALGA